MPSEISISLEQSAMMDPEQSTEQQTKNNDPAAEAELRIECGSDAKADESASPDGNPVLEDDAPVLEYKRSSSFLPDATFSDGDNSGEAGFFIEESHDDENDVKPDDLHTNSDSKEADLKAESKAQEAEDDSDDTAPLSTSTNTSFPTRSILKADVEEITEYAINTKKSKWRKLPAPDMEFIKMKRVESLNSIASSNNNSTVDLAALNNTDQSSQQSQNQPIPKSPKSSTAAEMKKVDSRVQFQHIVVREYQQTIGDNPSVGYGAPITLDWEYQENEPLDVDLYEGSRGGRRNMRQMHLNSYQRKNIFVHKYGFTEQEVRAAKKATNKVRSQREFSKMMHTTLQPLLILEEMRESAVRKFRRYRRRNSVIESESNIWIEEHNRKKQESVAASESNSVKGDQGNDGKDDDDGVVEDPPDMKRVQSASTV